MKRTVLLVVAALLIVLGGVVFVVTMSAAGWDFLRLSNTEYETKVYEISDSFHAIDINDNTVDIRILPSEDGKCRVELCENENMPHSVTVEGDTLKIRFEDTRKWYETIEIFGFSERIDLYLPEGTYKALKIESDTSDVIVSERLAFETIQIALSTGDLDCSASASGAVKITTSTGDVKLENIAAGELSVVTSTGRITAKTIVCEGDIKVTVNTGDVKILDSVCKSLFTEGDSGDLFAENLIAKERFVIERDTGDVTLEKCDAAEIYIETSTGDVWGVLLSDKTFFVETDTGEIEIPRGTSGGRCEIETDTGDVEIKIQ